jgi:hypothetical protein
MIPLNGITPTKFNEILQRGSKVISGGWGDTQTDWLVT